MSYPSKVISIEPVDSTDLEAKAIVLKRGNQYLRLAQDTPVHTLQAWHGLGLSLRQVRFLLLEHRDKETSRKPMIDGWIRILSESQTDWAALHSLNADGTQINDVLGWLRPFIDPPADSAGISTGDEKWSLERVARHLIKMHSDCDFALVSRKKMRLALQLELAKHTAPGILSVEEDEFTSWCQEVERILHAHAPSFFGESVREVIQQSLRKVLSQHGIKVEDEDED